MKKNRLFEGVNRDLLRDVPTRRYSLSDMISESYKAIYRCEAGSNLRKLAESHLNDVRNNPTEIDELSKQLSELNYLIDLVESGDLDESKLSAAPRKKMRGSKSTRPRKSIKEESASVWSRYHIVNSEGETIDSYTDRKDAEEWVSQLYKDGDYKKGELDIIDSQASDSSKPRKMRRPSKSVDESDDPFGLAGKSSSTTDRTTYAIVGERNYDRVHYFKVEGPGMDKISAWDRLRKLLPDGAEVEGSGFKDIALVAMEKEDRDILQKALDQMNGDEGLTESEDEDIDLTEEELEELTKHLEELRKNKKMKECDSPKKSIDESSSQYNSLDDISNAPYSSSSMKDRATIQIDGREYVKIGKNKWQYNSLQRSVLGGTYSDKQIFDELSKSKSTKDSIDETLENGRTDTREAEVLDTIFSYLRNEYGDDRFKELCLEWGITPEELSSFCDIDVDANESKKPVSESKSYNQLNLSDFGKKSNSKAFMKTFKRLQSKLKEGTALTRQESIDLYKASNSAMTQLSVELEHNPEFLSVFKEATNLLSKDVDKVLGSLKEGKAPSKSTMKSLAKFSESLLCEAEEEDDQDYVEDDSEENSADEFDQDYADARVDLYKKMAEKHSDSDDPAIQDKLAQDAEEVSNLPGITDEQLAELGGGDGEPEESEEDPEDDTVEESCDSSGEEGETLNEEGEDEDDITPDELAELKRHLKEMRSSKSSIKES